MGAIEMMQHQLQALKLLWSRPHFRAPLITIWVASFGGSLHAPVTTGYVRKIGASTSDIGTMDAITSIGMVVLSPVYGYLLDRYGGRVPIVLTSFFCGLGCAIRGFARDVSDIFLGNLVLSLGAGNLWTIVLSFISKSSPREIRSTVVSAFLFQVATLRLLGKCLYAPFDTALHSVLGIEDDMFRDRIAMGICTVFCVSGVFLLLSMPGEATVTQTNEQDRQEKSSPPSTISPPVMSQPDLSAISKSPPTASQWSFVLLSAALFLQAACFTATNTLWPIVLKDGGDFGNRVFGVVLFLASLISTMTVGAVPALERRFGGITLASALLLLPTVLLPIAFSLNLKADLTTLVLHSVLVSVSIAALSAVEPAVKTLATLQASANLQGQAFGALNAVQSLGSTIGSLGSTRLYVWQAGWEVSWEVAGATLSLPFMVTSALCALAALLLCVNGGGSQYREDNGDRIELLSLLPKALDHKSK